MDVKQETDASERAPNSVDLTEVPIRPGFACVHCSKAKRKCSGTDGTVPCLQCEKRKLGETCKPVSTRRRFTAPKKSKKAKSSEEWLAPRAKKADFKIAAKSRRKSSTGSSKAAGKSNGQGDSEGSVNLRKSRPESQPAATGPPMQISMPPHHYVDPRYASYVSYPAGFHHDASYGMPQGISDAPAGPRYPVYSHMENAAAWQPTAPAGFGGDSYFAYRGYSGFSDGRDGPSAAIAGDALLHMGAERQRQPTASRAMASSWMQQDFPSRGYMQDAYAREPHHPMEAAGYGRYQAATAQRRYTPGNVNAAPSASRPGSQAGERSASGHWVALPGAVLGNAPASSWPRQTVYM